jgi:hypothetical protein
MKLKEKTRVGGKVYRVYDEARTPYQRVLASGLLTRKQREQLKARYRALNPVALWCRIQALRDRLFELVETQGQARWRRPPRRGPDIELTRVRNQRLRAAAQN